MYILKLIKKAGQSDRISTKANSTYRKLAVQWFNWSFVLQNHQLLVAAKR